MRAAVIGAGAAGLIAAGFAAERADEVLLIEHNDIIGKKLLITGKGRCNITNIAETAETLKQYPRNAKFLYSALYSFTNNDIISLIEENGVKTKVERGGRVFPVSDKAADVVYALKKFALKDNVELVKADAMGIIIENGRAAGITTDKGKIAADRVIICTGGKSYPRTGSTGAGYKMAAAVGHTIIEPVPSLVPVVTEEKWVKSLMGLSLKNIAVAVKCGKKTVYTDFGEMLFTHFGVSGPVILSASAHMRDVSGKKYTLEIDLKPALDEEKLSARLIRDFEKYNKKQLINALDDLLPKALIPIVVELSGVDANKKTSEIKKDERMALVRTLKRIPLTVKCFRPIEEAIVTSGGVKTSEINPSTMESKILPGLFFAGEVIDADGYTGGYNLQMAFSTGYLAGTSI